MGEKLDNTLAVLNGLLGDYLVRTDNGLATQMAFYAHGRPVPLTAEGLARVCAQPSSRVVLLLHGTMCTESIWLQPDGSDYGSLLARDFGYTPLYVRYNTGSPIADNGAALDALLRALVLIYPGPIDELLPLGYSMGGLVIRSACHFAALDSAPWLSLVRHAIYVATPHRGAPAERFGRILSRVLKAVPDPYAQLVGQLADLRSAGVKDLGDADLRHEDRAAVHGRLSLRDLHHPLPLLPSIRHRLIAGALPATPLLAELFGDALVPVGSATDGRSRAGHASREVALPAGHVRVIPGLSHLALARHPDVYAQIRAWCEEEQCKT